MRTSCFEIYEKIQCTRAGVNANNATTPAMHALNGAHGECSDHFQCTPHICNSCFLIGLPPHRVYEFMSIVTTVYTFCVGQGHKKLGNSF